MDATPAFVDWEGVAFSWKGTDAPVILGIPWSGLPQFFAVAQKRQIPQFVSSLGPAAAELNSLNQLHAPRAYASVDPVALGTQALNDKGMHSGTKGGGGKQPKLFDHVSISETEFIQPAPESGSRAQTWVARRPTAWTDSAQTILARRPAAWTDSAQTVMARRPGGSTGLTSASAPRSGASSQGRASKAGWIIALAAGVVVLSVLAVSAGVVVLSYATPKKTPAATLTSESALLQSVFTPTPPSDPTALSTTVASATAAAPTFTLNENAFCRKGPDMSFPDVTAIPKQETVAILGVSEDGFWYYVYWQQFDVKCWVAAATGQTAGNSQGVPVLSSPDTSTPKPTGKPAPKPKSTPVAKPSPISTPTLLP